MNPLLYARKFLTVPLFHAGSGIGCTFSVFLKCTAKRPNTFLLTKLLLIITMINNKKYVIIRAILIKITVSSHSLIFVVTIVSTKTPRCVLTISTQCDVFLFKLKKSDFTTINSCIDSAYFDNDTYFDTSNAFSVLTNIRCLIRCIRGLYKKSSSLEISRIFAC